MQRNAGVLQRIPGAFEQQALLRIDEVRLARRDAETLGLEVDHVVEQPGPARIALAGNTLSRMVVPLDVPAIGGDLADGVAPLLQQFPELSRIVDTAGIAAADADHGDGFTGRAHWSLPCGSAGSPRIRRGYGTGSLSR